MLRRLEIIPLQASHACLLDPPIHFLKLVGGELLHVVFNDLDTFMVISQIRAVAFEADHIQCLGSLQ